MSVDLVTHEARQRVTGAGVMAIALGGFGFFGLAIEGSLGSTLEAITESMPTGLATFMGADSPGGYVVGEIFTLITPIALVAYAIIVGSSTFAGEERDGTMAILAAQPVSRTRVFWAKAAALALAMIAIGTVFWAGVALGGAIYGSELTAGLMAAGTVHIAALALAFGAIAIAVGAATGNASLASGTAGGLAVISYLTSTMLPLAGLDDWAKLSPWHYALGSDPLRHGVDFADLSIFAGIIVISLIAGLVFLNRRDLRG